MRRRCSPWRVLQLKRSPSAVAREESKPNRRFIPSCDRAARGRFVGTMRSRGSSSGAVFRSMWLCAGRPPFSLLTRLREPFSFLCLAPARCEKKCAPVTLVRRPVSLSGFAADFLVAHSLEQCQASASCPMLPAREMALATLLPAQRMRVRRCNRLLRTRPTFYFNVCCRSLRCCDAASLLE